MQTSLGALGIADVRVHFVIVLLAITATLVGCAGPERPSPPAPVAGLALVRQLVPDAVADRAGWSEDIYAAFVALELPTTTDNVCAVVAVIQQESGFRVDPPVPGLAKIAWREIGARRERSGIPQFALDAALALPSSDGRTFRARIDEVKTEKQLSEIYEDMIRRVPFGNTLLADRNPVRTGGPMQVSVAFAEAQVEARRYPYPIDGSIRHEVFSRRGGLYFGIAHLLDYPAAYDRYLYRFADFNAGRYASRNAAFQAALSAIADTPLAPDGDLLAYDGAAPAREASRTELAARSLRPRLALTDAEIRRDLTRGTSDAFERSTLYVKVFELADRGRPHAMPRARLPDIALQSPKITRTLTTSWFAQQVDRRFAACRARRPA
ncbi:MAG TPA: DUF1615 domain-containing protein [Casimicrobiaceae bacterium]|nr:DUF1615 domain-containing protein [Casimicrobiaceae bacterium]